jgi:AcrR family transcriptional regulator
MRYKKEHKEETRQRISAAAARQFRTFGVEGTGVASVMTEAGLTNGAFYAHFESKSALIDFSLMLAMQERRELLQSEVSKHQWWDSAIRTYLSPKHRDSVATGCVLSAIGNELARLPKTSRRIWARETNDYIRVMADHLPMKSEVKAEREDRARALVALMVGTLQMARIEVDKVRSDDILRGGIDTALLLLKA